MSINENPKLESVEELAGEAQVFLRDLIICCQFALDQEPGWPTVPDPPYRRPIDRRCDIESLIRRAEMVLRAALECKDGATLETLSDSINEIDREIKNEIPKRGSLPSRNETFKDSLNEISDCLHNWCKAVNFRARLLLALDPTKQKALLEKQRRFIQSDDLPEVFDYTPAFFANRFGCAERHITGRLKDWVSNPRGPQNLDEIKEGNRWKLSKEQAVEFEKFYRSQSTKKPKNKP